MVMINTTIDEMNSLIGEKLNVKDYEDLSFKYGLDLDVDGDVLSFEITSDRADIISKFSLAKLIKMILGKKVVDKDIKFEDLEVKVEKTERKYVNCLKLRLKGSVNDLFDDLILMQEKLNQVIGRNRKFAACGFFDFNKINFPIIYKNLPKDKIKFVPLGFNEVKDYEFVIESTSQGKDYGNLLKSPIVWIDKNNEIIALPPIINADKFSITRETKEIFIDVTGVDKYIVNQFTKILIVNLSEIGDVSVIKVKYSSKDIDPNLSFENRTIMLSEDNIRNVLGVEIPIKEAKKILEQLGFKVKSIRDSLSINIPYYRYDIIHQVDLVDDIMRIYGVDNIKIDNSIKYIKSEKSKDYYIIEMIRDLMIGMGYQELDLNILTSEDFQFEKTGLDAVDYAHIISSRSNFNTMVRKFIYPEGLRFLSNNQDKKFPQNLFDIGYVVERDGSSDTGFANKLKFFCIRAGTDENISDLITSLRLVIRHVFGKEIKIDDMEFPGLIPGRSGKIIIDGKDVGIIGEAHPSMLKKFNIPMPLSFFEIYI